MPRGPASAGRSPAAGRRNPPVLLPQGPRARSPLPGGVPLLAALGLAVLVLCTLPAVNAQQRLEKRRARLEQRTQEAAAGVERLHRELRDGAAQAYLKTKATRALLHNGAAYLERRDRCLQQQAPAPQPAPTPAPQSKPKTP